MNHSILRVILVTATLSTPLFAFAAETDPVVASLGTVRLRQSDVKDIFEKLPADAKEQARSKPELLKQLLQSELIRIAVLEEAKQKRWDARPEYVEQKKRMEDQLLVTSYLNDVARPPADYPSAKEIRHFYDENQSSFVQPARYHLAQIFLAKPTEKSDEKARMELAGELSRRAGNEDFAALAKVHSNHRPSADNGGDMGWVTLEETLPELRATLTSLTPGMISKPIQTAAGWHIVKLVATEPSRTLKLDDVRTAISNTLRLAKARQNEQEYLVKLLASGKLTYSDQLFQDSTR